MTSSSKGKTLMPEDFGISPEVRLWAEPKGFGPHLEAHLEFFRDYALSNGVKYLDWDAAFRNCIRADWGNIRARASKGKQALTNQSYDDLM